MGINHMVNGPGTTQTELMTLTFDGFTLRQYRVFRSTFLRQLAMHAGFEFIGVLAAISPALPDGQCAIARRHLAQTQSAYMSQV